MRPSVRLSVCPSVCLFETKICSTFRSVLLKFKGVRGADVQLKNVLYLILYKSFWVRIRDYFAVKT